VASAAQQDQIVIAVYVASVIVSSRAARRLGYDVRFFAKD